MKQVGVFEASTHLPALLDEVEKGGEVTLTRHGRPVARLRARAREINLNLSQQEIEEWIEEGRR